MPRGRLTEKYVQEKALSWLESHYAHQAGVRAVHHVTQTWVVAGSKLGSGRADGLVASLMDDGTVNTASLEAKSARTLPSITLRYGDAPWFLHALVAGLVGMGAIGWFFGGGWLLKWVLPPVAFFAVGLAYLVLTARHARYQLIDVVGLVGTALFVSAQKVASPSRILESRGYRRSPVFICVTSSVPVKGVPQEIDLRARLKPGYFSHLVTLLTPRFVGLVCLLLLPATHAGSARGTRPSVSRWLQSTPARRSRSPDERHLAHRFS